MTRTEERLADALDAAARALREDTLRPLLVPQRQRRRAAWTAPAAAAASLLLVVGVAVAVAGHLPGSGRLSSAGPPPRYYVESDGHGDRPVVRSTATGAVTDTVRVPRVSSSSQLGPYLVSAAANGLFFAVVPAATGVQIYRFRLTAAGRVSSLHPLPGVGLPGQLAPRAVSASPDGSRLAVALTPSSGAISTGCGASGGCPVRVTPGQNDQIDVVNTASGATSVWQGGIAQNYTFSVTSLSWTASSNELVYYGELCPQASSSTKGGTTTAVLTACSPGTGGGAKAEVWALSPASSGGPLTGGHPLLSLSAEFSDVPQALISPDGTTLTALALTGPANGAGTPQDLAVEQISLATGKRSGVLYSEYLGAATLKGKPAFLYPITLSADAAGRHWMLSSGFCNTDVCQGGFSGWIDGGRLVPLPLVPGGVASEAW